MVKKFTFLLFFTVFLSIVKVNASDVEVALNQIGIKVNGSYIKTEHFVLDGVTYVSLKKLSDMLKLDCSYSNNMLFFTESSEKQGLDSFAYYPQQPETSRLNLEEDFTVIKVNETFLTHKTYTYNEAMYVPLRAIAEALGCVVYYDDNTLSARIYSKNFASFSEDEVVIYGKNKKTITKNQFLDMANELYASNLEAGQTLGFRHIIDLLFHKLALEELCVKMNITVSEQAFDEYLQESGAYERLETLSLFDKTAFIENVLKNDYLYMLIEQQDFTQFYVPTDEELILEYLYSGYGNEIPFPDIKDDLIVSFAYRSFYEDFSRRRIDNDVILNQKVIFEPAFINQ